ncbi:MAG: mechanosensitive ion channel family protein [Peptococcaceae bacterium]|nr:mechanosensitive ion channel family protein [Peptococcaceae bacterium]
MLGILQLWLERIPVLLPYAGVILALVRVVVLILAAKIVLRVGGMVITKVFLREDTARRLEMRKAKTIAALLKSVLRYVVYFFLIISIVDALGAPTSSILASAGIVGLAVGFGAQNLVRDVLTGFFILFEDQFGVGDFVETFGVSGTVEEVGLRVTKLRDFSGVLHIIPNGAIDKVSNHNRGNLRALVDVRVSYEADVEQVRTLIEGVLAMAAVDIPEIVEGPTLLGMTDFTESAIVLRIVARVKPLEQWAVERELRRRIKLVFDREGIETPYPRRIMVNETEGRPNGK